MHQLTVRGFDLELEHRLQETARRRGVSLNKAALWLMRRGAGLDEPRTDDAVIGNALDEFSGTMTVEEARLVLEAVEDFERIDEEIWR